MNKQELIEYYEIRIYNLNYHLTVNGEYISSEVFQCIKQRLNDNEEFVRHLKSIR